MLATKNKQKANGEKKRGKQSTQGPLFLCALLAFVDLGLESTLDGRNGTTGVAVVAIQKVETVLFCYLCVEGTAGRTHNILLDVATDKTLDVLALENALDDQIPVLVNRPGCPKLREQKLTEMVLGTMQSVQIKERQKNKKKLTKDQMGRIQNKLITNLQKVGPDGLLLALTSDCGRFEEHTFRTSAVVCVVLCHDLKDTGQELLVALGFCTHS